MLSCSLRCTPDAVHELSSIIAGLCAFVEVHPQGSGVPAISRFPLGSSTRPTSMDHGHGSRRWCDKSTEDPVKWQFRDGKHSTTSWDQTIPPCPRPHIYSRPWVQDCRRACSRASGCDQALAGRAGMQPGRGQTSPDGSACKPGMLPQSAPPQHQGEIESCRPSEQAWGAVQA